MLIHECERRWRVERYSPSQSIEWNRFVAAGKNATFLFNRDYMDYHADRFVDHSLIVSFDGQWIALLPANLRADGVLVSHQGLTYGGFVFKRDIHLAQALEATHAVMVALRAIGIDRLVYKRIPLFYNSLPDGEVDYAMFLLGARLVRRDTAIVVKTTDRLPLRRGKKSRINKGIRVGLQFRLDGDFEPFWSRVLGPRLAGKYGLEPVHSVDEIRLLAARFPGNILQFSAYLEDRIVAGVTIFETPMVAHVQYSAIAAEGEPLGALDALYEWLIGNRYKDKAFFDFGICNENDGQALNHSLLRSKEGFGARAYCHDFYEIRTGELDVLEAALPQTAEDP